MATVKRKRPKPPTPFVADPTKEVQQGKGTTNPSSSGALSEVVDAAKQDVSGALAFKGQRQVRQRPTPRADIIRQNLELFDELQAGQRDELTRAFRAQAEFQGGIAQRGLVRDTQQAFARSGIEGGLAARGIAATIGNIRTAVAGAQLDFANKLLLAENQSRTNFINAEFDFFRAMDLAAQQFEFQKALLKLQHDLSDPGFAAIIGGLAKTAGLVLFTVFNPGAAPLTVPALAR